MVSGFFVCAVADSGRIREVARDCCDVVDSDTFISDREIAYLFECVDGAVDLIVVGEFAVGDIADRAFGVVGADRVGDIVESEAVSGKDRVVDGDRDLV